MYANQKIIQNKLMIWIWHQCKNSF